MNLYREAGHEPHRRRGQGTQHQLAVVAGYSWEANSLRAHVYLACGMLPSGMLRYSGRTTVTFANREEKQAFARRMHVLRVGTHHAMVASPLPPHVVLVLPSLLAEVVHDGWTTAGLMRQPQLRALRERDEPPAQKREGPSIQRA